MSSGEPGRHLLVEPGTRPRLAERDPGARIDGPSKREGLKRMRMLVERLGVLHNRLWAEGSRALLLILQGMDASGKDGTIRHLLTGLDPKGCRIVSFRKPTSTELAHDYLWRVHAACPARGELGLFNRSHYEDVVSVRVRRALPERLVRRRYAHIRAFEQLLHDEGTTVIKVFLHLSLEEQRKRLQERLKDPEQRWQFQLSDLDNRRRWDDFMAAYEEAMYETSNGYAPWYVVPADQHWVRNLLVTEIVVDALEQLDPQLPTSDPSLEGVDFD
jgi:PPK2 family polyphosphate:nucleotide phosphotransferase